MLTQLKNILFWITGICLILMMLLTAVDVGLRYVFNSPIPGGLEVVEFMMAILIPLAIVITAYDKAHIEVELLVEQLPKPLQMTVGLLTDLLTFFFFALLVWQSFLYVGEQYHSGLTSAVLLIPHYPFVASLAIAFGFLTIVSFIHFLDRCRLIINLWIP